ncbi:hypothetical protein HPULCUR_001225 [Helicostylum pulchrum]|uniref:Beta-lactamase n=1 Tax=Helicostylum pulchrum TaxID=562976 RepID=A0ABP9XNY9_9FUNG
MARSWYLKAANRGNLNAQYNIGVLYSRADVKYNLTLSWYLKAAKKGHILAQYNVGVSYEKGYGVGVDYYTSLYWYFKAAEQGYLDAKTRFVGLYGRINGVKQDYNVVREWVTKVVKGGNVGTEQDCIDSMRWFEKSLENGYEPARVYIDRVRTRKHKYRLLPMICKIGPLLPGLFFLSMIRNTELVYSSLSVISLSTTLRYSLNIS